jgi:hypothetical protein
VKRNRIVLIIICLLYGVAANAGGSLAGEEAAASYKWQLFKKKKKKQPAKKMGLIGSMVRLVLPGKFSKKLFTHYWTGNGDYQLSDEELVSIASEINRLGSGCCTDSSYIRVNDSAQVQKKTINFYLSKELAHALGYCTVYFKGNMLTTFFDDYDFNPKPWGTRPFLHEVKTRFMHFAGKLRGAKPFAIVHGTIPVLK